MLEHPWIELQQLLKEKWLTQKAFSILLWKKVSEVNELLKWKRNITIQWDFLLHQTLWTPIKYWILKQVDYEYSLLNIEEKIGNSATYEENNSNEALEDDNEITSPSLSTEEGIKIEENKENNSEILNTQDNNLNDEEVVKKDNNEESSEDFHKRARIFKTF